MRRKSTISILSQFQVYVTGKKMSIQVVDFRAFRSGVPSADAEKNRLNCSDTDASVQESPDRQRTMSEIAMAVQPTNTGSRDLIAQLGNITHGRANRRRQNRRGNNSGVGLGVFIGVSVIALTVLVFLARTPLVSTMLSNILHGRRAALVSFANTSARTVDSLVRNGRLKVQVKIAPSRLGRGHHSGLAGQTPSPRRSRSARDIQPAPARMMSLSPAFPPSPYATGSLKAMTPKPAQNFHSNHPLGALFSSGY